MASGGSETLRFTVKSAGRADAALGEAMAPISRRELRELFEAKRVRVDGRRVRKGDAVSPGQTIEVSAPLGDRRPRPLARDLDIVYEDESLVAIAKPVEMVTHPLKRGETDTAANWLVARFPETDCIGDDEREAGWVHRLDRGTSGVLLAARSREVWLAMRSLFAAGDIEKRYLALVEGTAGQELCNTSLRREGKRTVAVDRSDPRAMDATTVWRPKKQFSQATLLDVELVTGRTHQIRAHLAMCGHPIVGDALYGSREVGDGYQFLHARSLAFVHPVTGRATEIEAPLPASRLAILEELS